MQIYLDTARIKEIEKYIEYTFVDGITTNPSLIKDADESYTKVISSINNISKKFKKDLSIEVLTNDKDKIVEEAFMIYDHLENENLYIKVPISFENLTPIEKLISKNIKVNCTCVFNLHQVMILENMGVDIISIFYNRIKDSGNDPDKIIEHFKNSNNKQKHSSKLLMGSIRSINDVYNGYIRGIDIITIPPKMINEMSYDKGSETSINKFMEDVNAIKR